MGAKMSFQTRMSVSCAETLASFLVVAADRFKEDAKVVRESGYEGLALQFEKKDRQARKLADQFSEAYDTQNEQQEYVSIVEGY